MLCIWLFNAYLVIAHGLGVGRINSTHSRLLGFGAGVDNNGPDQARSLQTNRPLFYPFVARGKRNKKRRKTREIRVL